MSDGGPFDHRSLGHAVQAFAWRPFIGGLLCGFASTGCFGLPIAIGGPPPLPPERHLWPFALAFLAVTIVAVATASLVFRQRRGTAPFSLGLLIGIFVGGSISGTCLSLL